MGKSALVAAGFALMLISCGDRSVEAADVFVSITVTNDRVDVPVPDPVHVRGHGHVIHWEIKTPGFTFPQNGILVQRDTAREFDGGHIAEQGTKFQLNDKNSFKKEYKYTVTIMKGSVALTPLDPSIAND